MASQTAKNGVPQGPHPGIHTLRAQNLLGLGLTEENYDKKTGALQVFKSFSSAVHRSKVRLPNPVYVTDAVRAWLTFIMGFGSVYS